MSYLGDVNPGDILDLKFTTVGLTGAPTTLAGTPAVSVYKDNSTTQSTSGVTLTVDFDAVTGMHNVRIDTSADGTFYASGSNFAIVITTGTVGGTSVVGYVVGMFSIQKRNHLRPTTAGRTLDVSAGGEAGVDWANVGSPTTTLNLSGTSTKAVEPTVAGRTLDVSATGEAGIDWANIGAPTTTVNLSGTSINASRQSTAQAGAAGSITLDASASAVDDFYNDQVVRIISGTGAGQSRRVSDYVGSTKVASIQPNWATNPDNTSVFAVVADVRVNVDRIEDIDATDQIRDAVFNGVTENSKTFVQMFRGVCAALLGKASGLSGTAAAFRDNADTKDRIAATVDADGNRTAVTLDLT